MTRSHGPPPAAGASDFSIDSPHDGELCCMGPDDTLPIGGDAVNVSQIWVLVTAGPCASIDPNPVSAGASAVGGGTGPWSGGSFSGGDIGEHCVVVYWLNDGETNINHQQMSFE